MDKLLGGLKSLSDETRLRILNLLFEKELCVCDIMAALKISQAKASRHLIYMKNAGLLKDRKSAQWVYYSFVPNQSMHFIYDLVDHNLRSIPLYQEDLINLNQWLEQKILTVNNFKRGI